MATLETRPPVRPGEPAPDFALPAADGEATVALADYRGRRPVLLAFFRGLFCPFCRRTIAQFALMRDRLRHAGVEPVGVVATSPANARLYFRHRPTRLTLAADAELSTHRAYGLPRPPVTAELLQAIETVPINPAGVLPAPLPVVAAGAALARLDGYEPTETDRRDEARQFVQLVGEFLIDREGIVRWHHIECAREGLAGLGVFPSEAELLDAARGLA